MPPSFSDSMADIFRRQSPGPIITKNASIPAGDWRQAAEQHPGDLVLESWSQGFVVGSLIVMSCVAIANMRKRVLLHKLILLELLLAMTHGTFCFMTFNGYGWYLSSTATLLYLSWIIHNIVAWMKVRPFFTNPGGFFKPKTSLWVEKVYLYTLALTVPVIVFQIQDNFRFFNNRGGWYEQLRPYEPLMRDPWWAFTCVALFHVIRKCYGTGTVGLIRKSPRFGILLAAIVLSIIFTVLDLVVSIHRFMGATDGINPWWKLSLVFKCLTDTIMLDDFKTELKRLGIKRIKQEEARRNSFALVTEYPSGLDGGDGSEHTQPRYDTVFQYSHPRAYKDMMEKSNSPKKQIRQPSRDDENEDPLSDYAMRNKSPPLSPKPNNTSPEAEQDQVEFATALALDSSRLSGVDSVRRDRPNHERSHIRTTTKKISNLPGLRELRFEAIKPGKRTGTQHRTHDSDSDSSHSNSAELVGEFDGQGHTRNLAEEIQRTTIMDLEAQKKEKEDRDRKREKEKEEEKRRLKRFRDSIGAAE